MAVNKVIYGGDTLVDLTADTVSAETLLSGATAHGSNGQPIVGTFVDRGLPDIITPGDTPVVCCWNAASATNISALAETDLELVIPRTGNYRVKWAVTNSGSATISTQLYKNGAAVGTANSVSSDSYVSIDLACTEGDVLTLWLKGASMLFFNTGCVSGFCACIDWDTGI